MSDDDEILGGIRAYRERFAAEHGYDVTAMFDTLRARQAASGRTFVAPPEPAPVGPPEAAQVGHAAVTDDSLTLGLLDGRTVSVPVAWYPRLAHATATERANFTLAAGGSGVHWPDLDEDISAENVLTGRRSAESPASLRKWLAGRAAPAPAE